MEFVSRYISHQPDEKGFVNYSTQEHSTWEILYQRQMELLPGRACDAFLEGIYKLEIVSDEIPQLPDVSKKLKALTNWQVAPVSALISAREFFELLSLRKFPAATFIRVQEELDYVQEPDIFHEIFGHCPMLTNQVFADFVQDFAKKVLAHPQADWPLLQRLFWFTVEFGLVRTKNGLRAYGGGILSSIKETIYSVESDIPMRALFDPVVAFRTPYRIDMLQKIYFVIDSYQQLYDFVGSNIEHSMSRAKELGEFPPFFPIEENNPSIHILAC